MPWISVWTDPIRWRAALPQGTATDRVSVSADGVHDTFGSSDGGYGGIAYGSAPSPLPAVATPRAIVTGPPRPKHPQMSDTLNTVAFIKVGEQAPVLPAVLDNGFIFDVRYLLAELPGFVSEAKWQVWMDSSAPPDALKRLTAAGFQIQKVSTHNARVTVLGRQAPALALLLLLACAIAGAVLAVGGTAISVSANGRRRSYEIAALQAVGTSRRSLLVASVSEQLLLLGTAVVARPAHRPARRAPGHAGDPGILRHHTDQPAVHAAMAADARVRRRLRGAAGGDRARGCLGIVAHRRAQPPAGDRMTSELVIRGGVDVHCVDVEQVYRLDGQDVVAVTDIELDIDEGESIALFGPSGSGKSTLLSLLAGLRRPTQGAVWVGEHNVAEMPERQLLGLRGRQIGVVVQNPSRSLLPYGTAEDNILFARRAAPRSERAALTPPGELLAALGLAALAGQPVARLSGGEQQRLSVAVAMAGEPRLLLADEPTSQLDSRNRDAVAELLQRVIATWGTTMVVVTHDPAVADVMHRRVTLAEGRIVDVSHEGLR